MYCVHCGRPIDESAKFCPGCGTPQPIEQLVAAAEPVPVPEPVPEPVIKDLRPARRCFSRTGLGPFLILVITVVAQIILAVVAELAFPELLQSSWFIWAANYIPMYGIGIPVCLAIFHPLPVLKPEKTPLTFRRFLIFLCIGMCMMYAGNYISIAISAVVDSFGSEMVNPLEEMLEGSDLWIIILVTSVLAPILEELIFRKQMIDRMGVYGERLAVLTSAILFGLFHGNFSQFFYAFLVGLVFGYVYVKTGRLWVTILLHMFINFTGSAVPLLLLGDDLLELIGSLDLESISTALSAGAIVRLVIYMLIQSGLLAMAIVGLVNLIVRRKRITFAPASDPIPKGRIFRTVWLNPGMILLVIGCCGLFVMNYLTL